MYSYHTTILARFYSNSPEALNDNTKCCNRCKVRKPRANVKHLAWDCSELDLLRVVTLGRLSTEIIPMHLEELILPRGQLQQRKKILDSLLDYIDAAKKNLLGHTRRWLCANRLCPHAEAMCLNSVTGDIFFFLYLFLSYLGFV